MAGYAGSRTTGSTDADCITLAPVVRTLRMVVSLRRKGFLRPGHEGTSDTACRREIPSGAKEGHKPLLPARMARAGAQDWVSIFRAWLSWRGIGRTPSGILPQ